MQCMENFNFFLSKSQFGHSNESPWSHTLTLRAPPPGLKGLRVHEPFNNCFVVSDVVYTGLI